MIATLRLMAVTFVALLLCAWLYTGSPWPLITLGVCAWIALIAWVIRDFRAVPR